MSPVTDQVDGEVRVDCPECHRPVFFYRSLVWTVEGPDAYLIGLGMALHLRQCDP